VTQPPYSGKLATGQYTVRSVEPTQKGRLFIAFVPLDTEGIHGFHRLAPRGKPRSRCHSSLNWFPPSSGSRPTPSCSLAHRARLRFASGCAGLAAVLTEQDGVGRSLRSAPSGFALGRSSPGQQSCPGSDSDDGGNWCRASHGKTGTHVNDESPRRTKVRLLEVSRRKRARASWPELERIAREGRVMPQEAAFHFRGRRGLISHARRICSPLPSPHCSDARQGRSSEAASRLRSTARSTLTLRAIGFVADASRGPAGRIRSQSKST